MLYAQLTTGTPAAVVSRTSAKVPAHRFSLMIQTETNEPQVLEHEEVAWDRTHGTRIELEFTSSPAARKRLIDYLKFTGSSNLTQQNRMRSRAGRSCFAVCPVGI